MDRRVLFIACIALLGTMTTLADDGLSNRQHGNRYNEFSSTGASELGILPPNSILLGKSLGDWGGEWWKWAFSFDRRISPISDTTGKLCSLRQSLDADVWFLAGSYSTDPIVRECTIPEGKALFFPIINFIYYSPKNSERSCADVTESVKKRTQIPYNLFVKIDNKELNDPYAHREASTTCFDPMENTRGDERNSWAYPGASNGYWVAVEPLPVGTHIIQFGGNLTRFSQNITYKLHVIPTAGREEGSTIHPKVNSI